MTASERIDAVSIADTLKAAHRLMDDYTTLDAKFSSLYKGALNYGDHTYDAILEVLNVENGE